MIAAVTLIFDPLTLKLVHGVLVSQGPILPSLVFVGLFVFPLSGGSGQTDRQTGIQTDGQDQHMMGPPSRKDGPIKIQSRGVSWREFLHVMIGHFSILAMAWASVCPFVRPTHCCIVSKRCKLGSRNVQGGCQCRKDSSFFATKFHAAR